MGITHLETHRGKTKRFRIQTTAPTSPSPETGDIYIDSSAEYEAIGIYKVNGWVYVSLQE